MDKRAANFKAQVTGGSRAQRPSPGVEAIHNFTLAIYTILKVISILNIFVFSTICKACRHQKSEQAFRRSVKPISRSFIPLQINPHNKTDVFLSVFQSELSIINQGNIFISKAALFKAMYTLTHRDFHASFQSLTPFQRCKCQPSLTADIEQKLDYGYNGLQSTKI